MSMFIDRFEELKKLDEIYASKRAELVLVYGRRRIGKSRLLIESIKGKNALYLLSDMSKNILDIFASQTGEKFVRFKDWDEFFEYVCKSKYDIFIIDEFQYLYNIDKAWLTILQRWWEKLKDTKKKIILCGSIMSVIYKLSKGYGSALYGRKTYEIEIKPINFNYINEFFKYSTEDLVKIYSILGGIPRYLEEFDKNLSVTENIRKNIFEKTCFLYNEPMNLLYEEFRDATPYISILLAISQGKTKFQEISDFAKITSNKLPKYLTILERVKIIEKEITITEKKIKTKTTRYKFLDYYFRFWLKFVFPNKARIEQNQNTELIKEIEKDINQFIGFAFEDICKQWIWKNQSYSNVGKWWQKEQEIDIVAINENKKEILFCECKWKTDVDPEQILTELKAKAAQVQWNNNTRKEKYAIFAKSFKKKPNIENLYLYDLHELKKEQLKKISA